MVYEMGRQKINFKMGSRKEIKSLYGGALMEKI